MEKIPTNHGMMGIQSILSYFEYASYRVQREAGAPVEMLKKWYHNYEELEREYIKNNLQKLN